MSSNIQEMRQQIRELQNDVSSLKRDVTTCKTLFVSTLALMDRAGLKDAADIRRMIMLVQRLHMAYVALQAARMAAGDPLAWATAAVTGVTLAVDVATEISSH